MISVDVFLRFKPGIGKLDGMVDDYQHLLALHNILHKGNTEGITVLECVCYCYVYSPLSVCTMYMSLCVSQSYV